MLHTFLNYSKLLHCYFSSTGPDLQYYHNWLLHHGWLVCRVRGVTICIPICRACGNFSVCEDCSDEGGLCGNACDKPSLLFQFL